MTSRAGEICRMKRIGILGGTFDPIHNGHLAMAKAAYRELGLDKLLIIPAGRPYFKGRITPYDMRCDMVRIALEDITGTGAGPGDALGFDMELSLLESDQDNPTYTYQTLDRLKHEYPDSELFFICGADVFTGIGTWMKPAEVLRMSTLAVFGREAEDDGSHDTDAEEPVSGAPDKLKEICPEARCEIMHGHIPAISSTRIRDLVSRNEAVDGLVPVKVGEYIRSHSLYLK